jgi:chemotaxis-related protein WspB
MLLLMFYLGEELYTIDSTEVVEIVPRIGLRKIYQEIGFKTSPF